MPNTQADADGKGNPVTSEWQHTANDEPSDSDRCEKSQAAQREAYQECPATNNEANVASLRSSADFVQPRHVSGCARVRDNAA